ncbi:hypothetical protein D0Y65_054539 [Glycine soja]|uniref:Transmembrane protein n=1 Tax=Glycine soja TaxID=3848 RepID=A0A445F7J1_GLYSO|nr:hypothetical protein D0Y65_054539 [Glycine soja]RZB44658.1 hypothetical protein D0Y65_054539 [Glycine soja]RZB44659.1 hypothetical protein D0Y65_054539 [Glycine soja]RZB44660.1 hypothetical protein D0Y65_054539 [Glycine soja]RZB44661.1 hypothetical protein D0Y65_054539 [Glycine soja]
MENCNNACFVLFPFSLSSPTPLYALLLAFQFQTLFSFYLTFFFVRVLGESPRDRSRKSSAVGTLRSFSFLNLLRVGVSVLCVSSKSQGVIALYGSYYCCILLLDWEATPMIGSCKEGKT